MQTALGAVFLGREMRVVRLFKENCYIKNKKNIVKKIQKRVDKSKKKRGIKGGQGEE